MNETRRLRLAAFMRPVSLHTAAWRYPGAFPDANFNFAHIKRFAQKLESGKIELKLAPGLGTRGFFDLVLQNTMEGFFADPLYGGNKNMASWKMIGFPGARYDLAPWVSRYGERYALPPVGLMGRREWKPRS